MLDKSKTTASSLQKEAAPGWPSRCSSGLSIDETVVLETVGQRDRKSFHFKPEPSREPQFLRARILECLLLSRLTAICQTSDRSLVNALSTTSCRVIGP